MSNKFNQYILNITRAAYRAFNEWGYEELVQFNYPRNDSENDVFIIRQINLTGIDYDNNERHPKLVLNIEIEYENTTNDTTSRHNVELDVSDLISGSLTGFTYIKNPDVIKRVIKAQIKDSPISLPKDVRRLVVKLLTAYMLLRIEHYVFDEMETQNPDSEGVDAEELQSFYLEYS